MLETCGIVVFPFSMSDKDSRMRLLEKSFLLVDIKPDIVFGMIFLTISNANIGFKAQNL